MTVGSAPPTRAAPMRYVRTPGQLAALMRRVSGEPLLAVDTEAASFHRFVDRIYLIQLSTRRETAVIDPLTVGQPRLLGVILADPGVEVIFHDADYDVRTLNRDYGFRVRRLFDTRIAAQLMGEPAVGLAALLEKYLGVVLDKKFQRADWSRRPLPAAMLRYAATDTAHLPALRDRLRDALEALGRLAWAEEEFSRLESLRWTPPEVNGDAYLRLRGASGLNRRALAVLRELVCWREAVAAELDRASFRVLSSEALVALAAHPPRRMDDLAQIRGVSPALVSRRGVALLAAVERGLSVPEADLPRLWRPRRRPTDPVFARRVAALKAMRNGAAQRLGLDSGVLCANGTLEAIARANPRTLEELARIGEVRRWQAAVLGHDFLRALAAGERPG